MSTVLVVGSGGREHAIAAKLACSPQVKSVFVAPGNGGTEGGKISNVVLSDFDAITAFCQKEGVEFVFVGPEQPLAAGIADHLTRHGIRCFGPSALAAEIESSKAFSKKFMSRHAIPTAQFGVFTDFDAAAAFVKQADFRVVIKASGLAAGKGVLIPENKEEALEALKQVMVEKKFGDAGGEVVVEEFLEGEEASFMVFTDGYTAVVAPASQDHKRLSEGDKGLNTGGMGAYAPAPIVTEGVKNEVVSRIIQPTIDGLRNEGRPFVGVLYPGVILTKKGPYVLEFNCRLGDPETQVVLQLLDTDLFDVVKAACDRHLSSVEVQWRGGAAVDVVAASGGYPGSYAKGKEITGLDQVTGDNVKVFHAGTKKEGDKTVTSGGRVLAVTAWGESLGEAVKTAYEGMDKVSFEGMVFRKDIASRALGVAGAAGEAKETSLYAQSGVDIDAGNLAVRLMKDAVHATYGPEVISGLGSFGGLFDAGKLQKMKRPILVASSDGVGTKIKVAAQLKRYDTIGECLVNHCVNDILVQGARPLFFLDYAASSKLYPQMVADVVTGAARGCKNVGCALIGGETAEMPGVYLPSEFDLAGTIVGVVERDELITGETIRAGDVVLATPSTGLHTNGYSLARKVLQHYDLNEPQAQLDGKSVGDALLAVHRCNLKEYDALRAADIVIKGMAHITGGGLVENPPRIMPEGVALRVQKDSWVMPPLFKMIQREGKVSDFEMAKVFNCGLGMLWFVDAADEAKALELLGEGACRVGEAVTRTAEPVELIGSYKLLRELRDRPIRLGVLGSTRGTDMQAILDAMSGGSLNATIPVVVSNRKSAGILQRARDHDVKAVHVSGKGKSREVFDQEVSDVLRDHEVDLVLLIGYMRILSSPFCQQWAGRCVNVHPSLLPAFAGGMDCDVHTAVLEAGVKETGCTIHYVTEEVDGGEILLQKSCAVEEGDTAASLKAKVQRLEGEAFVEVIKQWHVSH